jgi:hypothetical protein
MTLSPPCPGNARNNDVIVAAYCARSRDCVPRGNVTIARSALSVRRSDRSLRYDCRQDLTAGVKAT